MSDLLQQLREAFSPETMTPEVRKVTRELYDYYEAIHKAFPGEFADKFSALNSDLSVIEKNQSFALGFRLGAQLFSAAMDSKYSS